MKKLLVLTFLFVTGLSYTQNCDKVLFTGKVIDTIRPQSFYNLMIINRSTGQGVFGQPNGSFSLFLKQGDSVSVSVKGYPIQHFTINADSNCQFVKKIIVDNKTEELREIVIKPLKTLDQIREEREALAMRETRLVTGIEVLQSPITALYQAFSKSEKNKRWIAEQEYKDNQRKIVKELLRLYVAYEIINLDDEEFDDFIDFLNVNEEFLKTATEMELVTFIKDKFEHFKIIFRD